MKTVPQRELRNGVSRLLREVEAGVPMRITVDGRPVADLVPIGGVRRTFVSRAEVVALLKRTSLDRKFARDVAPLSATIDEL